MDKYLDKAGSMRSIKINKKSLAADHIIISEEQDIPTKSTEFIWLDIETGNKEEERDFLSRLFKISDLAIDDAQQDRHPPKFEVFEHYIFVLAKASGSTLDDTDFNALHISFFISDKFLISIHKSASESINHFWDKITDENNTKYCDPLKITAAILKRITSRHTDIVMKLESRLEQIEDEMSSQPNDSLLNELLKYSTKTRYLHRLFNNQNIVLKELLAFISNEDNSSNHLKTIPHPENFTKENGNKIKHNKLSGSEVIHQFHDVQEHTERLASLAKLLNDVIGSLINGYISVSGHRLNKIMKMLTIVAIIFLPITFLAGIYGMNFEYMPELLYKPSYFIVIGVMIFIVVGLIILFKSIKWF